MGVRQFARDRRVASAATMVLLIATVVGLTAIGLHYHATYERSLDTQRHGLRRQAVVESVHPVRHERRQDDYFTYDYGVRLNDPVGGTPRSKLHDPSLRQRLHVGDSVAVLVNAERPDYAELPGRPSASGLGWMFNLGLAGLMLLVTIAVAVRRRRARLRPRTLTTPTPVTGPTDEPAPVTGFEPALPSAGRRDGLVFLARFVASVPVFAVACQSVNRAADASGATRALNLALAAALAVVSGALVLPKWLRRSLRKPPPGD